MANRILRDWTASESIDSLSEGAEVLFTRLIMKADDYGSFHSNPKLIKAALFPLKEYKDSQISKWVNECIDAKVLIAYTVDGKEYLRIVNFGQRLRNMRNTFPQPVDDPLTIRRESPPETKRNETETKQETETKDCADAPPFVDEVLVSWNSWIQHRKELGKKMTPSTVKKQIQFLGGRAGPEIIAIINQSIEKGWTGLFELKDKTNGIRNGTQKTDRSTTTIIEHGKSFGLEKGFSRSGFD